ncbi:MAG: tRNA (N(6)-L-threonylcarbamoyladenosine(37)-C(2))-methylthiotransferase MtaB [Anaerolineae bacterium]|nr:tRNA (N(6)-L-threonylcarbamoyladenosine(37)-C(2))-methylthiotransferase MtaB [Anaerolineae bacterium]
MKVYLTALGCKLNQAEVESLARCVERSGHQVVAAPEAADWAIINTCSVTHVAARKSRSLIRRLHRLNPLLRLAVTGCHAELYAGEIQALQGVDLIVPNANKEATFELLLARAGEDRLTQGQDTAFRRLASGHTRAFVKIQDGCDHRCAYCVVTIARGPSVSRAPHDILDEIKARVDEGYQEIVLTGVNIGAYGRDLTPGGQPTVIGHWSLVRLVQTVLAETSVRRLRLSSIEPQDMTSALLPLWEDDRVCRHVHLPLQSGCDATLERMGRLYTTDQFAQIVQDLRARTAQLSITTDVMVGFPGETEAAFEASSAFIERLAFSRLHVFRFSPRPGTRAASMADSVDPQVSQLRSERLIALGQRLARAFHGGLMGESVQVLLENAQRTPGGTLWQGWTDNYVRVTVPSDLALANRLAWVRCIAADEDGLTGQLISVEDS